VYNIHQTHAGYSEVEESQDKHLKPNFYLVMGVSGSGKTTVGEALAAKLGWDFYDGDDFHSIENKAKMGMGIPLNDEDRAPWLATLNALIGACLKENNPGVLACSALKERYRQILLAGREGVLLVYLKGNYEVIWQRMARRSGHYMRPEMLRSQYEALEEPEYGLIVDASLRVEEIVRQILEYNP
jgi:gluconokinase